MVGMLGVIVSAVSLIMVSQAPEPYTTLLLCSIGLCSCTAFR